MNTNFPRTRRALLAAALLGAAGTAMAQPAGEPITIGALLSTTGPLATVGIPERDGILLAQKLVNQRGGVAGRRLDIVMEDDASSPDVAVQKANALVHGRKVRALLGASGIGNTVAVGAITAPLKLPQVAFTGIGPAVEKDRTCLMHLLPSQELNARALLEYATGSAKARRVAMLHDSGYGQVVFNALKAVAPQYGVEIVGSEKFDIGATDVTTQAAKLRSQNPQAVFVVGVTPVPFRNVKQVKLGAPIISALGSSSYDVVRGMGDAADDIVFPEFVIAEDPLPHQKEFVEAFRKEYGRLPKNYEAAGFDGVMALARAFEKAGPTAGNEAVCSALRGPFSGVFGQYDFGAPDMTGLKLASYSYSRLDKGQFTRAAFKVEGR